MILNGIPNKFQQPKKHIPTQLTHKYIFQSITVICFS